MQMEQGCERSKDRKMFKSKAGTKEGEQFQLLVE